MYAHHPGPFLLQHLDPVEMSPPHVVALHVPLVALVPLPGFLQEVGLFLTQILSNFPTGKGESGTDWNHYTQKKR